MPGRTEKLYTIMEDERSKVNRLKLLGVSRELSDITGGSFGFFDLSFEEATNRVAAYYGSEFNVVSVISSISPERYNVIVTPRESQARATR